MRGLPPPATPFTAADLVHRLWHTAPEGAPFWAANFHDLTDLETIVAATLTQVLLPFGLVEGLAADPAWYQVTTWGAALIRGEATDAAVPAPAVQFLAEETHWRLRVAALPQAGALAVQAHLSRYSTYGVPQPRFTAAYHDYGLPTLWAALHSLGLAPTAAHWQTLQQWSAAGQQLTLTYLPILRTTTPAQLAALLKEPSLRPALVEVLNPTTAVVGGALTAFAAQLQRRGCSAALPTADQDPLPGPSGALWLAGQLYAHLGVHLPLPLPPPFGELTALFQQWTPAQQAVLHVYLAQLQEALVRLLDQLPFTPPPTPSDPAQWRPVIAQAIAANANLQMRYFTAGRNLTTQRLVEPYWIEERHGVPYLRAYCHSAGNVLTFRLDRIEALQPVP